MGESTTGKQPSAATEHLAARIHAVGARATPARLRVLAVLAEASAPLTHHDVDTALGLPGLDRVTLYRVLDWLVASGLATRQADARRVWRFALAEGGVHANHAHFRCDGCGRVYCLDAPPPAPPPLPEGFILDRAELDLSGRCGDCATAAPSGLESQPKTNLT